MAFPSLFKHIFITWAQPFPCLHPFPPVWLEAEPLPALQAWASPHSPLRPSYTADHSDLTEILPQPRAVFPRHSLEMPIEYPLDARHCARQGAAGGAL